MKPAKYQVWKDNAPVARFFVVTKPADAYGYVEIMTTVRSDNRLSLPKDIEHGRITYAREDRFDGQAGNYSFVAANMKTFNNKMLGVIHFARRLPKALRAAAKATPIIDIGTLTICTLPAATPMAGEIWREVSDARVRYVQVVGKKVGETVQIVTRFLTETPGHRPQMVQAAAPTLALESGFNGEAGGYEFVSRNLTELVESGVLQKRFVPNGETLESVLKIAFPCISEGQLWHDTRNAQCVELVKVVGVNADQVEVTTSYVSGAAAMDKVVPGMSVIVPIDEFAANAKRFNLVAAA